MDKPEWMPMNPCDSCKLEIRNCPLYPRACSRFNNYQCETKMTKKLLEYLRSQALIDWNVADPMLKQLEDLNG